MSWITKIKGDGIPLPPRIAIKSVLLSWLGATMAIALISFIAEHAHLTLLLGSFGASCVLVFGFPDLPFSQPRNVIFGHLICTVIGLGFLALFGHQWWVVSLAVGTAIAAMMLTRTVHPPAGSNPVIVFLISPTWGFVLYPTLIGSLMLVMVALLFNNLTRSSNYPKYW